MSQKKDLTQTEFFPMSLPEDSPAKISQSQANKQASTKAHAQDSGQSAPVFLGSFDPVTQSLKTSQHSLVESEGNGLSEFSGTYPRSGMMRSGTVYQLPNLARTITEIGSGLLPTPRSCSAMAATITPESSWKEGRFPNLETVVGRREWDGNGGKLDRNIPRLTTRKEHRVNRLKLCGNGVVPDQAALAIKLLLVLEG